MRPENRGKEIIMGRRSVTAVARLECRVCERVNDTRDGYRLINPEGVYVDE